jgi:predicted nucleic acid-binding protein
MHKASDRMILVFLSSGVLAELRYGMEAALRAGQAVDHFRETVEIAGTYPLAEIGKHTVETYGEVKARLAAHYLDLSRRSPQWLDDWQVRGSTKTLQIDENDLWLVAQAIERNRRLITTDARLADRFEPVISELRLDLI